MIDLTRLKTGNTRYHYASLTRSRTIVYLILYEVAIARYIILDLYSARGVMLYLSHESGRESVTCLAAIALVTPK